MSRISVFFVAVLFFAKLSSEPMIGWFDRSDKLDTPKLVAAEGGKLILLYASQRESVDLPRMLDACAESGIRAIVDLSQISWTPDDVSSVTRKIETFRNHPALAGWYIADEPDHQNTPPAKLEVLFRTIKKSDDKPVYVALLDLATITLYKNVADVFLIDRYPVFQDSSEFGGFVDGVFLYTLSVFIDTVRGFGKSAGFILQGFGSEVNGSPQYNRRNPTQAEMRWMLNEAWFYEPDVVLFWIRYKSLSNWVAEALVPELRAISMFSTADRILTSPRIGPVHVFVDRKNNDFRLVAINNTETNQRIDAQLLKEWWGAAFPVPDWVLAPFEVRTLTWYSDQPLLQHPQ